MEIVKEHFYSAAAQLIERELQIKCKDLRQCYETLVGPFAIKKKWAKLGDILGVDGKHVHDYFYNTWSKQFYDDAAQHKDELRALYFKELESAKKVPAINKAIEKLQDAHPDKKFYKNQLYQQLYTIKTDRIYRKQLLQNFLLPDKRETRTKEVDVKEMIDYLMVMSQERK